MKKYMFFPLWKIEKLEDWLEEMEKKGYFLDNIKYSYFFSFRESVPREGHYFLTYKSFRGAGMGSWEYALESTHKANPVKTKMCFYSMYRTKESKEKLSLLFETRLDYFKRLLLGKAFTALFVTVMFASAFCAAFITSPLNKGIYLVGLIVILSAVLTTIYFFGYCKQRKKCEIYEKSKC